MVGSRDHQAAENYEMVYFWIIIFYGITELGANGIIFENYEDSEDYYAWESSESWESSEFNKVICRIFCCRLRILGTFQYRRSTRIVWL